jgi:hypothetical protein
VDFSIYKNFAPAWLTGAIGEAAKIQFRLEMFNAFNTTNFVGGLPTIYYGGIATCGGVTCTPTNNTITSLSNSINPNFGVANRTRGPREIQYAFKFYF